jgi:hypothetical protein
MISARSLENSKLRDELKKLRGALKDLKDDKLIEISNSPTSTKPSNYKSIEVDKLDSLRSEDIENLCKFDKIIDSTLQEPSESSLKPSEKLPENVFLENSKGNSLKKSYKDDPLYDHLLDSSLKFSVDSHSGFFDENPFKSSNSGFDRIRTFTGLAENTQDVGFKDKSQEKHTKSSSFTEKTSKKEESKTFFNPSREKISFSNEKDFQSPSSKESSARFKNAENQNLLDEIEKLRNENNQLREQLKTAQSMKNFKEPKIANVPFKDASPKRIRYDTEAKSGSRTPKKTNIGRITVIAGRQAKTGRTRSFSRSKSKSLTPRDISYKITNSPLTPKRFRHCNICDHLLSKGYSTKYCSKHGTVSVKP